MTETEIYAILETVSVPCLPRPSAADSQGGETAQVADFVSLDDLIARRGPAREFMHDDETGLDMDDACAFEDPMFDAEDDVVLEEDKW